MQYILSMTISTSIFAGKQFCSLPSCRCLANLQLDSGKSLAIFSSFVTIMSTNTIFCA